MNIINVGLPVCSLESKSCHEGEFIGKGQEEAQEEEKERKWIRRGSGAGPDAG